MQSFVQKIKILKFVTKNVRFLHFGAGTWKYYCHIWNQRVRIYLVAKFGAKIKILKFRTKNAWFGYFWTGSWKLYSHILNQHPRICLIARFHEKMKMPKFGTKNVFAHSWSQKKWYCHIWNQPYQICLSVKFCEKTKTPKFGVKNALFGYFWATISKNYSKKNFNNNLKICTKTFILMSWNSRKKMKSLVKPCFWTFQKNSMIVNLQPSCLIYKFTTFSFISIVCLVWIAIYHLQYFMLQSVLKFYELPGQQQNLIIWSSVLIFGWYGWKKEVVNVPVSFYYWKWYLGNNLRYFVRLQIQLTNLVSFPFVTILLYVYICSMYVLYAAMWIL